MAKSRSKKKAARKAAPRSRPVRTVRKKPVASASMPAPGTASVAAARSLRRQAPASDPLPEDPASEAEEVDLIPDEIGSEDGAPATSKKQIAALAGVALVSFLIFLFLFFPFDGILRTVLRSRMPEGLRLDFTELRPSLFGTTRGQGLLLLREPGFRLDAETMTLDVKPLALLRTSARGSLRLNDGSFTGGPFSGSFKSIEILSDLGDVLRRPMNQWEGTLQLRVNQFEPDQIPRMALLQSLPLTPADLAVARLQLKLTFSPGSIQINQGELQSTLFHLRVEGSGSPGADLASTSLDARLCVKPVDDLESRNAGVALLYGKFIAAGAPPGAESCFKVKGLLSAPSFSPAEGAPAADQGSGPPGPPGGGTPPPPGERRPLPDSSRARGE